MKEFLFPTDLADAVTILTAFVLIFWFYYSQKQSLAKSFFTQLDGIYAGWPKAMTTSKKGGRVISGLIMNIRDTDDNGYFKGEFDLAERESYTLNEVILEELRHEGIYTFLGKMDFRFYRKKERHPYDPKENRIYKGTLYLVDRLDFDFNVNDLENYIHAVYDVRHYRDMQVMEFTLRENRRSERPVPEKFSLQKKRGASFEPYSNVKNIVFKGQTYSDI